MFKLLSIAAMLGCVIAAYAYADGPCASNAPATAAISNGGNAVAQTPQAQGNRSFSYQPGSYNNGYGYGYQPAQRNWIPTRDFRNAAAKATWQY